VLTSSWEVRDQIRLQTYVDRGLVVRVQRIKIVREEGEWEEGRKDTPDSQYQAH
jgi:hypothetical protein